MWEKILREIVSSHRGKIIGIVLGLFVSILIITYGFFKAAFIILCVGLGYYLGKRLDNNKEDIAEILDRILPPDDR
ncbi:MAG: DUF2273 domain-containing protein [bacterium]